MAAGSAAARMVVMALRRACSPCPYILGHAGALRGGTPMCAAVGILGREGARGYGAEAAKGKRRRADGADGPRHAQGARWPRDLRRHERSFASSAAHAAAVVAKEKAGAVKADAETPARVPQHIDAETWALVCTRLVAGMQKVLRKETWGMLALLRNSGHEVYLVGGTVRDMVLGRLPKDVDVLTTATLDEVQRLLRRNTDRSFVPLIIGKRHPIVQVFRKEVVMNEDGKTTGRIQRKHLLDISSFFTDAAAGEVPEHGSTEPAPPKARPS